jgi:nucleoside-diphosphate-sugar epimerase
MKTILLIGAIGKLGEPVARHLKGNGFHARIFTKKERKPASNCILGTPLDHLLWIGTSDSSWPVNTTFIQNWQY